MSWQDRDKLDLKITTGDGDEYTVFWMTAQIKVRWHGNDNSFIELNDSKVEKRKRMMRSFPMEFYFEGADHLETCGRFRTSLDDPNPCVIEHPYYNTIICQILELDIDNSAPNLSRCTCTVLETMSGTSAIISNPLDAVKIKAIQLNDLINSQPEAEIKKIDNKDVLLIVNSTKRAKSIGERIISLQDDAQNYLNGFNNASAFINNWTSKPLQAMLAMNEFLAMPGNFVSDVQDRINALKEQFDTLRTTIKSITSPAMKNIYISQEATLLGAMAQAAVSPLPGNYTNAIAATIIATIIQNAYLGYQLDADTLQTDNNGSPLSFAANFDISKKLDDLMMDVIGNLYQIALAGRKQRTYQLPNNSNVILLTHMLYRLDPNDINIQTLIDNNKLTYQEIALGIQKGRKIVYYI